MSTAPRRADRLLVALPARLPVLLFWTALVASLAVLGAAFTPWLVLPVLAGVVWLTWRLVPEPVPVTRAAVQGAGVALALALAWLLANAWFAGQVLLVQRDPGFLTLEGLWLAEHADPDIPLRSAAAVADAIPGAQAISDAFWRGGDVMYAQGAKAFPALIALPGWLFGPWGVLLGNLVIGAVALLAVYDLGRRLIDPRWALLPVAALALTTPFLYFTRTPFTEPTNVVLTFGGLAVLWGAYRQPRLWPFALGGAMLGANALSRIDGAAVAAGLVLGLGVVAAGTRDPARRRLALLGWVVASAAAGLMVLLGYLDVRINSPGYLDEHVWLYQPLIAMLVACVVAAAAGIALCWWTPVG
ncbi:MAG TPA: glycosyltransferase family 39 protein, partial [Candidatus Nanopelagicales bacterium]